MFLSELAYQDIAAYARNLLKKYPYSFNEYDIANEVFLRVSFLEENVSESQVKKIAFSIFMEEYRSDKGTFSFNEEYKKQDVILDSRVCVKCEQSLPPNAFYIRRDTKTGFQSLTGECRVCLRQRSAIYYKENKRSCLTYNKEWQRLNKSKVAKHCKKYWTREVDELSDVYISWYLRNCENVPQEAIDSLPDLIIKKREELLIKRNGKKRARESTPKMICIIKNGVEVSRCKSLHKAGLFIGNPISGGKRIGEAIKKNGGKEANFMGYTFQILNCA